MTNTHLSQAQAEDAAVQLERDFLAVVRENIGMNEALAGPFARALVDGLRQRLGGQELYVPAPDRCARDAAIRREFDGTRATTAGIMRRTGLSRSRVYAIAVQRAAVANCPAPSVETGQDHR